MFRYFKIALVLLFVACSGEDKQDITLEEAINEAEATHLAHPTAAKYVYQEPERIMFVHLFPASWQDVEWDMETTPLKAINPKLLDIDYWV